MTEEEAIHATNDALMECAHRILEIAERTDCMATGAVLVYEILNPDGDPEMNYVVTQDMKLSGVVGLGHYVREEALSQLLYPDE